MQQLLLPYLLALVQVGVDLTAVLDIGSDEASVRVDFFDFSFGL